MKGSKKGFIKICDFDETVFKNAAKGEMNKKLVN